MTNFSDLDLKDDKIEGVDFDNVGEERAAYAPLLPEADFEFQLPGDLKGLWEISQTAKGQRVRLQFNGSDPLIVSQAKDPSLVGSSFTGSISNVERNRARRGEPERVVSDLGLLVRNALLSKAKITGQKDLMTEVNKYGGKRFVAYHEWSAYCGTGRVRWVTDAEGNSVEDPEGTMGCGARYYSSAIPKLDSGGKAQRFGCTCGASIMARGNLIRFRPAKAQE